MVLITPGKQGCRVVAKPLAANIPTLDRIKNYHDSDLDRDWLPRHNSFVPKKSNTHQPAKSKQLTKAKAKHTTTAVEDPNEVLPADAPEYRELCGIARFIQQDATWEYMQESNIFGVRDPETDELGFVSVMGALGEYKAVVVYRGVEGLNGWREFNELLTEDLGSEEVRVVYRNTSQIHLSFEDEISLEEFDLEVIKNSLSKFPDDKPQFRSQWPGYFPWFFTRAEARFLINVLTQTTRVAKQFFDDPNMLPLNETAEDRNYLIRVPQNDGENRKWTNRIERIDGPSNQLVPLFVERTVIEELKSLPTGDPVEIAVFTLPSKIGEPNERPRVLYALMVVNAITGYVFGFKALDATGGGDLMYAEVPGQVAAIWLKHQVVPSEVRVRSRKLIELFGTLCNELKVKLMLAEELPAVDEAKLAFVEWAS